MAIFRSSRRRIDASLFNREKPRLKSTKLTDFFLRSARKMNSVSMRE